MATPKFIIGAPQVTMKKWPTSLQQVSPTEIVKGNRKILETPRSDHTEMIADFLSKILPSSSSVKGNFKSRLPRFLKNGGLC